MKEIQLTQGKVIQVSDNRFEYLNKWNWFAGHHRKQWYAERQETINGKKRVHIFMHRVICNTPEGMETDHKDGNGLNNQDENIRICTRKQNSQNQPIPLSNTSGYKGVVKSGNKWEAQIHLYKQRSVYIGVFDNPIDAARAYDKKAIELFGEFANTNFEV